MPASKAVQAEVEKRRSVVAANLVAGVSYSQMAKALGVSRSTIAGDVKAIMKVWKEEQIADATEYIRLEERRLDMLLNAIWDKATGSVDTPPDLAAADRVLKIMERRARLRGLDAPTTNLNLTPEDLRTMSDDDLKRIAANQLPERFRV